MPVDGERAVAVVGSRTAGAAGLEMARRRGGGLARAGAGVISGAIMGGFILGMVESVGLTVLAASGDITYLVIFASLMVFLAIRPQGLMGKPWG